MAYRRQCCGRIQYTPFGVDHSLSFARLWATSLPIASDEEAYAPLGITLGELKLLRLLTLGIGTTLVVPTINSYDMHRYIC